MTRILASLALATALVSPAWGGDLGILPDPVLTKFRQARQVESRVALAGGRWCGRDRSRRAQRFALMSIGEHLPVVVRWVPKPPLFSLR